MADAEAERRVSSPSSDKEKMKEPANSVSNSITTNNTDDLMTKLNMDPYDEDQAELRVLHSKPTCFIVLGKPGAGKTTLARRLALEWKCELISATDVLSQAIDLQTEMGLKAQEILLHGEAIPEEMAAKMIEDKINSPEVAHHGYVLDGFPSLSEDYMSIKDQLELVKNWKLKPDFIVNLKIPDKDLELRRVGQRVDPETGNMYTREQYAPEKPNLQAIDDGGEEEGEEEEAEEEELGEEEEEIFPELEAEILERLIKRPEDLPSHVTENIEMYKSNVLRILEDYMADHDQQYLIELDSNKSTSTLFKELMLRLNCFVLRPAAVPVRLQDPDDEEIPEDADPDEMMRSLAGKKMVAPRFRWRRSKWMRNCPVALAEGNILPGKPEFAVGFLDKIYVMSSGEAMEKFMKNPRPYLLPPQPRPPCKMSVSGPPLSGKTTLCALLAQKYGAKVLDIDELIKPRMEQEKKNVIEQARQEATENAINVVTVKMKEQRELEEAARQAQMTSAEETAAETEADREDDEGDESKTDEKTDETDGENTQKAEETKAEEPAKPEEGEKTEEKTADETTADAVEGEAADPGASVEEGDDTTVAATSQTIEVDAEHPDVVAMVEAAVKAVESQPVVIPPEVYVEVMEAAIQEAEKEMRAKHPDGPLNGGWILDNFPRNRDQWSAMVEKNVMPDEVIYLKDDSPNGDFLIKRWYQLNKADIDQQIAVRKEVEEKEKREKEEEARRKEMEEKQAAEEAAKKAAEEERQRRIDEGEDLSEEEEDSEKPTDTDDQDADDKKSEVDKDVDPDKAESPAMEDEQPKAEETEAEAPAPVVESLMPAEGPEVEAQRQKRKEFDTEWPAMAAVISGNTAIEPLPIDIEDRSEEDIVKDTTSQLERQFMYQGWERIGLDVDEEDEDMEADQGGEEEEEAGEEEAFTGFPSLMHVLGVNKGYKEEDPNRSIKKQLGDTNYFCPVALKENGVLWPGNPEVAARYREKTYYLSTPDARDKFLNDPTDYLPKDKPLNTPPMRLMLLGPRGAGKTLHGRHLAQKLGLFHIQFRERLQEMIIAKTKKKKVPTATLL